MNEKLLHEGARLYARWLALEIVVAHGDEIEPGLAEGNLQARLGVPVLDAFNRYRDTLPEKLVNKTHYFEDALNSVLARGEKVF